ASRFVRSSPQCGSSTAPRRKAPSLNFCSSASPQFTRAKRRVKLLHDENAQHFHRFSLPRLRERTIKRLDSLCFRRVRLPSVGTPQGVTGWRPPFDLPSPPPCGWSTGFIAEPRTVGRFPFQRLRPALPPVMFSWSTLPTWPIVARHVSATRRSSPDGSRRTPCPSSFATSWTPEPALRASWPPLPG